MPFIRSFSINTDNQRPFPFNIPAVRFARNVQLDEPEAALSPLKQLSLISFILEVLKGGKAQFIIATHSPILMGIPEAALYEIREDGMPRVEYKETDHYRITKRFLDNPESYLRHLR